MFIFNVICFSSPETREELVDNFRSPSQSQSLSLVPALLLILFIINNIEHLSIETVCGKGRCVTCRGFGQRIDLDGPRIARRLKVSRDPSKH